MALTVVSQQAPSGEGGSGSTLTVQELDYRSKYPGGLDLRPSSALHGQVLTKIMSRAEDSYRVMSERHESWAQIDQVMRAYIPLSEYEKKLKTKGGNEGAMHNANRPVSIMVPYSYATRDTLLTYLDEAFLVGQALKFQGTGPEDEVGAKLMELVVDYQVRRQKAALAMHNAFSDGLTYGIGPSTFEWVTKWGRKATVAQFPQYGLSGELLGYRPVRQNVDALLYEGNRLHPIDPYRYLPDPNVSADRVQDGEFVGWVLPVSFYQLMAQEKADSTMFNVRLLSPSQPGGLYGGGSPSKLVSTYAKRINDAGSGSAGFKTTDARYHEVLTFFCELIPKEWGLGSLEEPEIWHFTVADDRVILRARPIDMNHRSYPVAVAVPDSDGYSITPISRMETIQGLQGVLNWMFNSHVANVRKSINDMLIVDPSLVMMQDLENPDPGKLVRLRRSAWGRGVDNAVKQLQVQDVTRGNMADALQVMEMIQRASGAVDALQGIMRSGGERRSATEAKGTMSNALSRLEKLARLMGLQYVQDVAYFYASHTQQYMSQSTYAKAVGSWPEVLRKEFGQAGGVAISPLDLLVDFDVVYSDGTTPTSGAANADTWAQMFQTIGTNPLLAQQFDVPRLFMHIARLLGANNLWDFVRQQGALPAVAPQVLPDQQVLAQAQAGNAVPLDQIEQAS